MRKFLLLISCISFITYGYAGTITDPVGDKSTGDTYTAAEFNSLKNAILNEINGNLDQNNLKNNAVTTDKITNDAVTPDKIDDDNATAFTMKSLSITNGITASTMTTTSTGTFPVANITTIENSPTFTYGFSTATGTFTSSATIEGAVINTATIEEINNTPSFTYGLTGSTMTLSAQPCCRVYLSADLDNRPVGNTFLAFDTESYDVSGDFDVATGSFTASIAGYYAVNLTVFYEAADLNDGTWYGAIILKNSTSYTRGISHSGLAASNLSCSISDVIPLAVGDTISAHNWSNDSNVDLESGEGYTFMTIRLVQ